MENASKALIMAGGILIAMLIILLTNKNRKDNIHVNR